ncbi:family 16 glycosylhydrolase [Aestuariibaculum sp. YM273]|uniref:glycoside hydrolase family 16 protein n=1 Tax=Aestuariibaculum sp. YM273 TaxID=3070659 RepID=UPI0027DDDDC4|nr:family 16 glycosylhydrolase [Aestuariibaculum sp. YM273]WMI65702.1 family 16 glycosylhydrolase [Aestuariibaculum sp. YM273]
MLIFRLLSILCISLIVFLGHFHLNENKFSDENINEKTLKEIDTIRPFVYLDSTSFNSQKDFEANWNMLYPWGKDHNGTARMFPSKVSLKAGGILEISADWNKGKDEGESSSDPHLPIAFHSGAIHLKQQIKVTKQNSYWEISGDFQAPTDYGTWPAFWITGAKSWPPEIDMLEFKGNDTCWQNTVSGKDWRHTIWTTEKTVINDAASVWHHYKVTIEYIDEEFSKVKMYIDGVLKSEEIKDYTNKPFWLIINLQMEGASGQTQASSIVKKKSTLFRAKNVYVAAITRH